jgi:hypothetical protein
MRPKNCMSIQELIRVKIMECTAVLGPWPSRPDKIVHIDVLQLSIQCFFDLNFSTLRHQNEVKNIDIKRILTRHILDVLVWLDVNKTTIFFIKTLRFILLTHVKLVCLVGHRAKTGKLKKYFR